jgi:hypothetical protein
MTDIEARLKSLEGLWLTLEQSAELINVARALQAEVGRLNKEIKDWRQSSIQWGFDTPDVKRLQAVREAAEKHLKVACLSTMFVKNWDTVENLRRALDACKEEG